jgi:hypothetical protein
MVLALVICIIIGLAYAQSQWHIISNIYRGTTTVSNQLLDVYPCSSTPIPGNTSTGTPFKLLFDINNPNPATVNGRIMINFTRNGIVSSDVRVTTNATYNSNPVSVINEGIFGNTSAFIVQVNATNNYFSFNPGSNFDVTYIFVDYYTAGTYQYAFAIVA